MTCWKLLTVLPILRPTSGNFLGPNTSAATPAITTSSGIPSPNIQVQDRAGLVLGRPRTRVLVFRVKKQVDLRKDELLDESKRDCEMGVLESGDEVAADVIVISIVCSDKDKKLFKLKVVVLILFAVKKFDAYMQFVSLKNNL